MTKHTDSGRLRSQDLTAVVLLAVSQTVPTAFAMGALPLFWRQMGYSLVEIGILQLLYLPWVLKALWAPLVDRLSHTNTARLFFLMGAQISVSLTCIALAIVPPGTNAFPTFCVIVLLSIASANADSAGDALTIRLTPANDSERVNGWREGAALITAAAGVGGGFFVAQRFGWTVAVSGIALISLFGITAVLMLRQSTLSFEPQRKRTSSVARATLIGAFIRPKALWLFATIALASAANRIAGANPHILLADLDLSAAQIGWITGTLEPGLSAIGAVAAGLSSRWIGWRRSLPIAAAVKALLFAGLASMLLLQMSLALVLIHLGAIAFAFGWIAACIGGMIMRWSRRGSEATDAASFFTVAALVWMLMQPIAGALGDALGYQGAFLAAAFGGLVASAALSAMLSRSDHPTQDGERQANAQRSAL